MSHLTEAARLRLGVQVFVALLIVTVVEFLVAVFVPRPLTYLLVTALIKAGLIVHYFMHITHLWHLGEE